MAETGSHFDAEVVHAFVAFISHEAELPEELPEELPV
jgi:HD-GYP domain-containing protein (c-di-GMP phosphodiesterase class II)